MKILVCVVVYLIWSVEGGRRVVQPLDKSANVDFINMEGGGGVRAAPAPGPPGGVRPVPAPGPPSTPPKPAVTPPKPVVTPRKPVIEPMKPVLPQVLPPAVVTPTPRPPSPVRAPVTPPRPLQPQPSAGPKPATPGPGSVQQLINYYDSQGKASPIRPYTYSQSVKQG